MVYTKMVSATAPGNRAAGSTVSIAADPTHEWIWINEILFSTENSGCYSWIRLAVPDRDPLGRPGGVPADHIGGRGAR